MEDEFLRLTPMLRGQLIMQPVVVTRSGPEPAINNSR